ncbi:iron reductase domain protein [Parathielavia appendiculata]|uniref:Iron reductase domain protein n=1 Tax=Parathielavia appendiculata TaxID=2587402 RepID=A0AAN6U2H0_9PEZI|nr:iron reductase domain protein [Parathielavia appendiculata]
MLWTLFLGLVAALLRTGKCSIDSLALAAAQTANAIYRDSETGLVFSSNFALYKADGRGITYRVAIPDTAQQNTAYDVVIQMVVPNDVGWAGLAWGGSMPRNPLLVAWRGSNNNVVLSSRMASGHVQPTEYSGAQYTLFQTGTKSNSTHWQFTALCKGCTAWQSSSSTRYLNPRGGNRLAMAYSPTKPSNVNSPSSSIPIHEVHAYWSHDFAQAANTNFEATVQRLTS